MEYAVWYTCVTMMHPRGRTNRTYFRWSEAFGRPVAVTRMTEKEYNKVPYESGMLKKTLYVN